MCFCPQRCRFTGNVRSNESLICVFYFNGVFLPGKSRRCAALNPLKKGGEIVGKDGPIFRRGSYIVHLMTSPNS